MRIAVDLQGAQNGGRGRGIGRYALALTRAMAAAGRGHEFRIVLNAAFLGTIGPIRAELGDLIPQAHIVAMSLPGGVASSDLGNAWRTRAAEVQRAQFIEALGPTSCSCRACSTAITTAPSSPWSRAARPRR